MGSLSPVPLLSVRLHRVLQTERWVIYVGGQLAQEKL